ncbi:MAG: 50S ribosomal protein L20, partial [Candidatus Omnitrophica bacterium]|nr:50S ribosomal protein L20 [Candidatus Omnitrophota bacterium]
MRVTHGVASKKRHKKVLKRAKGYWGKRSKLYRRAVETVRRALVYGYRDRRAKKREFRSLWITRLNAASRERGLTYRELIHGLKLKKIALSRDVLAKIAAEYPETFDKIVEA